MSDDIVIRAERLGKKYAIGHTAERERYVALRDVLVRGAHNLLRKTTDMARGRAIVAGDEVEEFWALKGVSFEVKRGEVLGIIGRNGAGKTTLLKILSRITEPSEGRVMIRGRVASLLEVGTGFHPELTGRENIYLNGAILGMTRGEIRKKFEEIVAFAEVEKFLDTPVKRYSSGMYVRLAFAVAAHLEPEILVVDEVLAVGDFEFQKKCLGKMESLSQSNGKTVLLISHDMVTIKNLCEQAIHLHEGSLIASGSAEAIVSRYLHALRTKAPRATVPKRLSASLTLEELIIEPSQIICNQSMEITIQLVSTTHRKLSELVLIIYSAFGARVGIIDLRNFCRDHAIVPFKRWRLTTIVKYLPLVEGNYTISLFISSGEVLGRFSDLASFAVWPSLVQTDLVPYPVENRGTVEFLHSASVTCIA